MTRSALTVTLLCVLTWSSACSDDAAAPEADWLARLDAAQRLTDSKARLDAFTELRGAALGSAEDDRIARGTYLAALEQLTELQRARGAGAAADQVAEERRVAAQKYLAKDPGDGFVRGLVGYIAARSGRYDEAWKLMGEGASRTDPTRTEEARLLYFTTAVAAMGRMGGDPEVEKPGLVAHATLLAALVQRARGREADEAHMLFLLETCTKAQLSAGRLDEASASLAAWEKLDPASTATVEVGQQIRDAKR